MPSYFPENNEARPDDTEVKSLQKINDLLDGGITVSVGEVEVKNDTGNPVPVSGTVTANVDFAGANGTTAPSKVAAIGYIDSLNTGNIRHVGTDADEGLPTGIRQTYIDGVGYRSLPIWMDGTASLDVPISGTVTANGGNFAYEYNEDTTDAGDKGVLIGWRSDSSGEFRTLSDADPLPVTVANATLPVSDRGATGETTVSSFTSTTSATLKSSNPDRKLLTIYNEGAGNLHVLYGGGTASTTNYSVKLFSGDYLEVDKYTGQINAIFATAGTARVTQIT